MSLPALGLTVAGLAAAVLLPSFVKAADQVPVPESARQIIMADPLKEILAIRRTGDFRLDGRLDEKFWQEAPIARGFRQSWPKEGEAASESTWTRIAYDDEAVYIGVICFDSRPDQIRHRLTRRDRESEADYFTVNIDSYHDRQTAYSFCVNASGVQLDRYIYNDNWSDDSWDAVWESRVANGSQGWTAEMRIPYHCLRFPEQPTQAWGIDFIRYISRNDETTRWQFVPRAEAAGVSRYGVLAGIAAIHPPRHIEVLPYTVAKVNTAPKTFGNPDGRTWGRDMGLDFKWALASNTILDATVNPDFGQVEADETVLNLSRFETRYSEKRPFFLEGLQLFDTPFSLFYSRRIGAAPSYPSVDDDSLIIEQPEAATILYAGKLSGKTKKGLSYAMLNAVTADEHASYYGFGDTGDTLKVSESVADRSVANVMRLRQDILGNSSVGVMMTSLNRHNQSGAYTGGLDWNLRTRKNVWRTMGQVVASSPGGGASGWGTSAYVEKVSGKHIVGQMGLEYEDRALDINSLGYLQRNDYVGVWGWWQYRTEKPFGPVLRTWHNTNWWWGENTAGQRLQLGGNYNNQIQFKNMWYAGGGYSGDTPRWDDHEIEDGPAVRHPRSFDWWVWMETDARKRVAAEANLSWGSYWEGGYYDYTTGVTFHPATNLELALEPEYYISWDVPRYVTDLAAEGDAPAGYLFAEQHSERFSVTARGTATFTTNLSVQFYGEVFVADVNYDNYGRLVGPGRYESAPELSLDGTDDDPDFSMLDFNANVVLRWEYRPGSTLFLVWTQARDGFIVNKEQPWFTFHQGVDRLFDLRSQNVFMVKLNYWWNL